ncbi:MAG: UDP-N-acetylmuramoyl-tripeptide--D-alanyl-D-alanine ligase [Clostridia bacterium]|nr:UDP-N-acetylmuramoyl-tripeptide--D-alanyl-D-alanine ligase [Clostridia bacterium]
MDGRIERIVAAFLIACFYLAASGKLVAAMQQCGYGGRKFCRWYHRTENVFISRFVYWGFLSAFATLVTVLSFSEFGEQVALAVSAIPFFFFALLFYIVDRKYALKVPCVRSGRLIRLSACYFFFVAVFAFCALSLCSFLGELVRRNGAPEWLVLARYFPVSFLPLLLPYLLLFANLLEAPFERARNKKFVKRAGQVLNESNALKIAVVGSYGKTSVKEILGQLLSVKYKTALSPLSYNTPIGVSKTVFSDAANGAEAFVFEMGARKRGDIAELCALVSPSVVAFTGVCAQHIQTFGSEAAVLQTKCECIQSGAETIICGEGLKESVLGADFLTDEEKAKCKFICVEKLIKDARYFADKTTFTLCLNAGEIAVETALLGKAATENIALAASVAETLGLTREEISLGISHLKPIAHRLELKKENGIFILDDAYNANEKGAAHAVEALCRFEGKKYLVTPGIVEAGILQKSINGRLGEMLARAKLDGVALVGGMQVKAVKDGYLAAGGDEGKITVSTTLEKAVNTFSGELCEGDAVLFLNDLPDVY